MSFLMIVDDDFHSACATRPTHVNTLTRPVPAAFLCTALQLSPPIISSQRPLLLETSRSCCLIHNTLIHSCTVLLPLLEASIRDTTRAVQPGQPFGSALEERIV